MVCVVYRSQGGKAGEGPDQCAWSRVLASASSCAQSDRVKIVELPLFNSYLFVRCTDPELRNLTRVYGVARIVYYNGKPAVVRQKEIDAIQDFLDQASEHALCPGEEVEILCGAMKHVSGKVKKIKKNHLVLYLEQLGATVCVKLDDVARVDRLK